MSNDLVRNLNINVEQIKEHADFLDMAIKTGNTELTLARAIKIRSHVDQILSWSSSVALQVPEGLREDDVEFGETFDAEDYDWGSD